MTANTTSGTFVVRLADIEAGPVRLDVPVTRAWLEQALEGTEAKPWLGQDGGEDEGRLSVQVARSGRKVLVRGAVRVAVTLPCARTLDPANYHLEGEVFLLLSPAPSTAQPGQPERGGRRARARDGKDATRGATGRGAEVGGDQRGPKGAPAKTSGKKKSDWEEDPELSEEDAASDTFSGDQVVLDDFLREFILLELPMFPVREDLRSESFEASSAHPSGAEATEASSADGERPLDPRLSPLAELKARLDQRAAPEKKE